MEENGNKTETNSEKKSNTKEQIRAANGAANPPYLDGKEVEIPADGEILCEPEWFMLNEKLESVLVKRGLPQMTFFSNKNAPTYATWANDIRAFLEKGEQDITDQFFYRFKYEIPKNNYVGRTNRENVRKDRNLLYAYVFQEKSYTREEHMLKYKEQWAKWYPESVIAKELRKKEGEEKKMSFITEASTKQGIKPVETDIQGQPMPYTRDEKSQTSNPPLASFDAWPPSRLLSSGKLTLLLGAIIVILSILLWRSCRTVPPPVGELVINLKTTYPDRSMICSIYLKSFADKFSQALGDTLHRKVRIQFVPNDNFAKSELSIEDQLKTNTTQLIHLCPYYLKDDKPIAYLLTGMAFGKKPDDMKAFLNEKEVKEYYRNEFFGPNWWAFPTGNTGEQTGGWYNKDFLDPVSFKNRIIRFQWDKINKSTTLIRFGGTASKLFGNAKSLDALPTEIFNWMYNPSVFAVEWVNPTEDRLLNLDKALPEKWVNCKTVWNEPSCVPSLLVNKAFFQGLGGLSDEELQQIIEQSIKGSFEGHVIGAREGTFLNMQEDFESNNAKGDTSRLYKLDPSDLERLKETVAPVYEDLFSEKSDPKAHEFYEKYFKIGGCMLYPKKGN